MAATLGDRRRHVALSYLPDLISEPVKFRQSALPSGSALCSPIYLTPPTASYFWELWLDYVKELTKVTQFVQVREVRTREIYWPQGIALARDDESALILGSLRQTPVSEQVECPPSCPALHL